MKVFTGIIFRIKHDEPTTRTHDYTKERLKRGGERTRARRHEGTTGRKERGGEVTTKGMSDWES